jgi:hypothetical protein
MSGFDHLISTARQAVEAVHAGTWRIYPMESVGGVNARQKKKLSAEPFERQGCYYIESRGDVSRFRPDVSSKSGNAPSLHHGQEETVSITASPAEIKTGYVLLDIDGERWFSVTETEDDGAGNIVCSLAKSGGLPDADG